MPKRPIRQTLTEHPDAAPDAAASVADEAPRARGGVRVTPLARREAAIREATRLAGDPLVELARLASLATDPAVRAGHLRAMLPYVHPQQKAIEVGGAGGEPLTVEVVRLG